MQSPAWDHPRVCGEKPIRWTASAARRGSPPRVRGEAVLEAGHVPGARITPACAGRRHSLQCTPSARPDHPRVCGEKQPAFPFCFHVLGSPPRVRGEVTTCDTANRTARITPACAGRSRKNASLHFQFWDHPRVCGEKFKVSVKKRSKSGSPPRVRGEALRTYHLFVKRITPACAGRREISLIGQPSLPDHPRVCGEKTKKIPNISRFYPGAACFSFSFS